MRGLGRYYELDFACVGRPDPQTGYLINIKDIDRAARSGPIPIIAKACDETPQTDPAQLLPLLVQSASSLLPVKLAFITLRLTPTLEYTMHTDATDAVLIAQEFDFAAAHRLHVPELSDEENRERFGRCNNPSGHGHNYRVKPVVRSPMGNAGPDLDLQEIERLTDQHIIDRFDHAHLNKDTEAFGPGGDNPSVENIARVFFDLLSPAVAEAGGELVSMTVWETDRTSATYPA